MYEVSCCMRCWRSCQVTPRSPRQTSPDWVIWVCDHTHECWLGYTDTNTPWPRSMRSPPATQIMRSTGTPACSMTRTVS